MEAPITPSSEGRNRPWDLLAFAGFAGLAALALRLWPALPDPLPTHWGLHGNVNGWTSKSALPWLMFGLPAFVWLLLLAVGSFAVPKDPALARLQRRAMAPLRGFLVLAICVLQSGILLVPLWGPGTLRLILLAFLALLAAGMAIMAQGIQRDLPPEHRSFYKWGLFYVNPADPRLLVPKLLGLGWTFNYARASAWWITALLLALPLAAVAFTMVAATR